MKKLLVVLLLVLAVAAFAANDLLILHCESAGDPLTGVENNIGTDPFYGSVDYLNGADGLVDAATLAAYDCVFTWNNLQYTAGQGDALADYVDAGGTVVVLGWGIFQCYGRILDDATYCPIDGGSNEHGSTNLGTTYTHDILDSVSTITGINYRVAASLESGATLIAEDTTFGDPLVAINTAETVVAINMVAGDYISWSGDGWVLFNNAIQYLMSAGSTIEETTWGQIKAM
ncbi:hypothetical protein K8R78_00655 [bacterium]|nr:hypothetical protein [bacterium]